MHSTTAGAAQDGWIGAGLGKRGRRIEGVEGVFRLPWDF